MENQMRVQVKNRSGRRKRYTPRYLRPPTPEELRRSALFRHVIAAILALMCGIGGIGLVVVGCVMHHENQQLEKLAELVGKRPASNNQDTPSPAPSSSNIGNNPTISGDSNSGGETIFPSGPMTPDDSTEPSMLPQYELLYHRNSDFFGWIQIEDTKINYPIMHTPYDPEKYLHANFDGEYSYSGLPFLDADCTENSDNLLIYGHHMLDGSMFTGLTKYKDKSYWESHPIIKLSTLYQEYEYEVMLVFYDRVYSKNENVFKFYQFLDADNEQNFNNAIANFRNKQLYDTGIDAVFGDQLITLVTCEYHVANGRFVVVARRK